MTCTEIKLLALDMDGTLLDSAGHISEASRAAMRAAQERGVQVVLATGRDYNGIPWAELEGVKLDYAITTNGSAVYRIADRACLFEKCLPCGVGADIFDWLLERQVYIDVFIDGRDYVPREVLPLVEKLVMPDYVMQSLRTKRTPIDNLSGRLRAGSLHIQKGTLNFWPEADGTPHAFAETAAFIAAQKGITAVDGGFGNLEFTAAGVSKATALSWLAARLNVSLAQTMAVGDSENDTEMLRAAGLGVAMGNAPAPVRALAAAVTASNDEDGAAKAIEKYILNAIS